MGTTTAATMDGSYAVPGGGYGDDAAADDDVPTTPSPPLHGLLPTATAATTTIPETTTLPEATATEGIYSRGCQNYLGW